MSSGASPSTLWPEIIHPYAPILKPQPIPSVAPFDEPCACLIVNAEWRGYLIGALEVLAQVDAWQGDDAEIDAAILNVDEIIACLIGDEVTCLTEITDRLDALALCCQQQAYTADASVASYRLELQSLYDGTPLSIDPDTPQDTWTETTGDSGDKILEREAALCRSVDRYLKTLANDIKGGLLLLSGIGGLGVGMVALANPVVGIFAGAALYIAQTMGEYVWDDVEALRKNACCMYASLESAGTIDFDTFKASLGDCSFTPVTTEEWQRAALHGSNQDESNYLAFLSAIGQDTRLASIYELDTLDCDCQDDWSMSFLFNEGEQSWTAVVNDNDGDPFRAVYVESSGWGPQDVYLGTSDYQRVCWIRVDFAVSATITRATVYYDCDRGVFEASPEESSRLGIQVGGSIQALPTEDIKQGVAQTLEWTGSETFNRLQTYFRTCYRGSTPVYDGDVRIYRIDIGGSGDPPEL